MMLSMHANCFTKRLVVSPAPAVKPRVPPVPCKKRTALQLIKAGGQCTGPSVLAPRRKNRTKCAASAAEGGEAPVYLMPRIADVAQEKEWLTMQMREWLNEEWPAAELLEVHDRLAEAVATVYLKARASNQNDLSDVLLALSTDLSTSFDFFPTFTDPFEVSNKATEVLMLRDGADICCAQEADRARVERVSGTFRAQHAS